MPAYATTMRIKFPALALGLEVITIILFALFAEYDDGKGHGHDPHPDPGNSTAAHAAPEDPMSLYPSESLLGGVGGLMGLWLVIFEGFQKVLSKRPSCLMRAMRQR